ncbi:male sterility protein-domain-containing protein, partial [Roridomyces roridus]
RLWTQLQCICTPAAAPASPNRSQKHIVRSSTTLPWTPSLNPGSLQPAKTSVPSPPSTPSQWSNNSSSPSSLVEPHAFIRPLPSLHRWSTVSLSSRPRRTPSRTHDESPYIRGAIMFGRERNQIGVLIEPHPQQKVDPSDEKQLAEFRNLIWPIIQEANENAPSFARIYKEMILVTQPNKPMVRAPKGTVIKKATWALYNAEIDAIYNTIEASSNAGSDVEPPVSWTQKDLEPWLMKHASQLADRPIRAADDLFDQGFDSLNATFLRHRIVGALRNSNFKEAVAKIPQNIAYSHPSIQDLTTAIVQLVRGGDSAASESDSIDDHKAAVEAMITKYSQGFDVPLLPSATTPRSSDAVVLLTGTTGALGSHLLAMLLESASVQRVYAFNRRGRTPISERQHDAFVDRGLNTELLSSGKLIYLEGDTAKVDLSLPADVLTELRDTINVIIHNAWMLDFNKKLSSFESHIKGTRNLIDLARSSPNAVRFLFTSSIASAQALHSHASSAEGWDQSLGPFPEELQLDASVAVGNGYGEGKYASERVGLFHSNSISILNYNVALFSVMGGQARGQQAWSSTEIPRPAIQQKRGPHLNHGQSPNERLVQLTMHSTCYNECVLDLGDGQQAR